ncbi:hypothetical protein FQN50_001146 [Emmonsiellopsis sp. PD_5]|nr:hypothetical protein FQN50_001146 [Emmonsiellopsis sp. PD_5]
MHPSRPPLIALQERGVEMVEADLNDTSTLSKAVAGSHVVFGVTNIWDKGSHDVEVAQGKAIADAAVAAGAAQIIWSSLPSVTNMTRGEHTIKGFDSKAVVEAYIHTLKIKSTFFMAGWFMKNHLGVMKARKMDDGTYLLSQPWGPSTPLPLIDTRDTGKFLVLVLLNPDLYHTKRLSCATAFSTSSEMVDVWSKVTGKTVRFEQAQHGAAEYKTLSEEERAATDPTRGFLRSMAIMGRLGRMIWLGPLSRWRRSLGVRRSL